MAILKSYKCDTGTMAEGIQWFEDNPQYAPGVTNEKRIKQKFVDLDGGGWMSTEVWDCTEEEHESNGWGVSPQAVKDALGMYQTTDHLDMED